MTSDTHDGRSDAEGESLDEETGVGVGDPGIKSTDEPLAAFGDDPPDHKSGLETQTDAENEASGDDAG